MKLVKLLGAISPSALNNNFNPARVVRKVGGEIVHLPAENAPAIVRGVVGSHLGEGDRSEGLAQTLG